MNSGKDFETQFKKSVEDDGIYYCRLNDPAQSFHSDGNLRFSPKNPYDCFLFSFPNLFCIELKTSQGSMTFYKDDFEKDGSKHTYMIKKHQIEGLKKVSKYNGVVAGFILNFRKTNHTYFLSINDFTEMIERIEKKSFNENDVIESNGVIVEQTLKRVKYKFEIAKLMEKLKSEVNKCQN